MFKEYQLICNYENMIQNISLFNDQIQRVIELIEYEASYEDGFTIYVEKSPAARAVAESELIPDSLSYKIIEYNHHSLKGKLEKKKSILLQLAKLLEEKRRILKESNQSLEKDLFFLFNNLNIRHNNINTEDPAKYKQFIAQMSPEEMEKWYDEIYQMCLLAFLQIEHSDRKTNLVKIKNAIVGCAK